MTAKFEWFCPTAGTGVIGISQGGFRGLGRHLFIGRLGVRMTEATDLWAKDAVVTGDLVTRLVKETKP